MHGSARPSNQNREARLFVCREQLRSKQTRSTVRHNTLPAGKVEASARLVKTVSAAVNNQRQIRFIDLFAGCGGLLERFIQVGYAPVAHVEMNDVMCHLHLNGMGGCNAQT